MCDRIDPIARSPFHSYGLDSVALFGMSDDIPRHDRWIHESLHAGLRQPSHSKSFTSNRALDSVEYCGHRDSRRTWIVWGSFGDDRTLALDPHPWSSDHRHRISVLSLI